MAPPLNDSDHKVMDEFLKAVLERYRSGDLTLVEAREKLAHTITAASKGNAQEVIPFMKTALAGWDSGNA